MGGCCFSPRPRQLLWWYWLLLFSVVGIPMFISALYIQRKAKRGILQTKQVLMASWIFWFGAFLSIALIVVFGIYFSGYLRPIFRRGEGEMIIFVFSFFLYLAVAVAVAKVFNRFTHPLSKIVVLLTCLLVLGCVFMLSGFVLGSRSRGSNVAFVLLLLSVMKFAACMLPAHYWRRFTVSPGTKNAWVFLVSLLVGTALFWAVGNYGPMLFTG